MITITTFLFKTYSFSNYDSIKIAYMGMLFSMTILFLAFLQNIYIKLGKRISVIGDLTYSTYLLHFPLQLIIIGFTQYFDYNLYLGKIVFIIYFIILLLLSYVTYQYFELPAQKYVRQKFNNKYL
jgi:peptidoglycan/LPS O-acetylase OafA/YrhL